MDIDILFWILIAALPIISGFLEKRRKQQQSTAEGDRHADHAAEDDRDPELGSALEEIRRVLGGEYVEQEHDRPHWEEHDRPHWEEPAPQGHRSAQHTRPQHARSAQHTRPSQDTRAARTSPARQVPNVLPDSPLVKSPENLMELPMPAASAKVEVEEALTAQRTRMHVPATPSEIRHAIILADVLGTPRFKHRHRPL